MHVPLRTHLRRGFLVVSVVLVPMLLVSLALVVVMALVPLTALVAVVAIVVMVVGHRQLQSIVDADQPRVGWRCHRCIAKFNVHLP